jgi:peptide chain release factor 3
MKDPLGAARRTGARAGHRGLPVNWPIGNGPEFQGIYDRQTKTMHTFERVVGGKYRAPVKSRRRTARPGFQCAALDREADLSTRRSKSWRCSNRRESNSTKPSVLAGKDHARLLRQRREQLRRAAPARRIPEAFARAEVPRDGRHRDRAGEPGLLRIHLQDSGEHGPATPRPHRVHPRVLRQVRARHDGDPRPRSGKKVRLSSSHKLFGNERETVNEAYPGDIHRVGGATDFGIGDTLTTDPTISYREIPRFTPESFAYLHNPNTGKYKQFRQGLDQLLQEGVIQVLHLRNAIIKIPLLAAVGPLQFEVVQFRLESEYGAESRLESAPWTVVRWLPKEFKDPELDALALPTGAAIAFDMGENPVVLFANEWSANYFQQTNPKVPLSALPVQLKQD